MRWSSPSRRSTRLGRRVADPLRAVLDPNVLIAALLSQRGSPGRAFRAWLDGLYELIVSPSLLAELERALAYPKLRRRIPIENAEALIHLLRSSATVVDDPPEESVQITSRDPGDDYLLALAISERAALVTGDGDLLTIAADLPIYSPAAFIEVIASM
jgi:uncharacterized protein